MIKRKELYDNAGNIIEKTEAPYTKEELTYMWLAKMRASDSLMDRNIEELIERDGTQGLSQEVIERYTAKKALRAEKPT